MPEIDPVLENTKLIRHRLKDQLAQANNQIHHARGSASAFDKNLAELTSLVDGFKAEVAKGLPPESYASEDAHKATIAKWLGAAVKITHRLMTQAKLNVYRSEGAKSALETVMADMNKRELIQETRALKVKEAEESGDIKDGEFVGKDLVARPVGVRPQKDPLKKRKVAAKKAAPKKKAKPKNVTKNKRRSGTGRGA